MTSLPSAEAPSILVALTNGASASGTSSTHLYSSTKRDKPFHRFQNPTPDKFKYSAFLAIAYWDRGRIPVDGIKTYMKSPDLRHPNREQ
ncbi:hypothetical protein K456DRAFT_1730523 [Colletotrichum gloeosporioides 23]|nr:hypothetical protein K456DRAFT_1730523 [Colletotrichum gloeosporioides 23]